MQASLKIQQEAQRIANSLSIHLGDLSTSQDDAALSSEELAEQMDNARRRAQEAAEEIREVRRQFDELVGRINEVVSDSFDLDLAMLNVKIRSLIWQHQ